MSTVALGVAESGIGRAGVIGAGAMGAGIAAQFANAGIPVELLDVAADDARGKAGRDAPAAAGIARQVAAGGFMGPAGPGLVRPGNVDDHLDRVADCDWIVEAVAEDLAVKRALYHRLAPHCRPGAIVSSNTSTIPHAALVDGLPDGIRRNFVIAHFFNPPRAMPLVEIVATVATAPETVARVRRAAEVVLGKTVVDCRDTPGFIANRIGCFWMAAAAMEARRLGLTVEEADAVHRSFGVPRTGVFGLFDLVGIDLVPQVWGSLMAALPDTDRLHLFDLTSDPVIRAMIDEGRLGRKAGAGFYRKGAAGLEALDLARLAYRPARPVDSKRLPGGGRDLVAVLDDGGPLGAYGRAVFGAVLGYALENASEIADDVGAIDAAMTLGYGWRNGPFALADMVGAERVAETVAGAFGRRPPLIGAAMEAGGFHRDGRALCTDGAGRAVATGSDGRFAGPAQGAPLIDGSAARLWDLGDGIAGLELRKRMGAMPPAVFDVLEQTIADLPGRFRGLVIGNDDPRAFSVGADLDVILGLLQAGDVDGCDGYIRRGQDLYLALRYAPFPVVAAMHGFALGGGCELGLHADAIVAHAELAMGLPEVNVGLIPAWGGCTQCLRRAAETGAAPAVAARSAFAAIGGARISGAAEDARTLGYLSRSDGHVMARAELLPTAKRRAMSLAEAGYVPPARVEIVRPGPALRDELIAGRGDEAGASADDLAIAAALAEVLCGAAQGPVNEVHLMAEERSALLELCRRPATAVRMEHMLKTGKPLKT